VVLAFVVVARIFGQSLLVYLPKSEDLQDRRRCFSGALLLGLALAVLAFLIFLTVIDLTPAVDSSTTRIYFSLQSFAAIFMVFNLFQKFTLISQGRQRFMLAGEVIGNALNFAFNGLAFYAVTEAEHRFFGVAVATICSQLIVAIFYAAINRELFQLRISYVRPYWMKAKSFLRGESLSMLLLTFTPFFITMLLDEFGQTSLLVTYNFALKWSQFFSMPLLSLSMLGTVDLSKRISNGGAFHGEIHRPVWAAGMILSLVPTFIFILVFHYIRTGIGFPDRGSESLFVLTLLIVIPAFIDCPYVALSRAVEKPHTMGHVELFLSYLLKLPACAMALYLAVPGLATVIGAIILVIEFIKVPIFISLLPSGKNGLK
jgi:Na+-driven multidrug efflux pump